MEKTIDNAMMNRRSFLSRFGTGTFAAAAGGLAGFQALADDGTPNAAATEVAQGIAHAQPKRLIVSAPVLQNAAERSMGVAFAVSADASGWVEISETPDMSGARRVYSGGLGMMEVNDKIAQILVRGLRPATRYWYRVGADRIDYQGGYRMKNLGSETDPKVHSFTTLGAELNGSFCIINDTHERRDALKFTLSKLAELNPSVVIWNGDVINKAEDMQRAMNAFIHTHEDFPEYAADTPFMFLNGNHDFRGRFARHLERVWMFRDPAERDGRFAELGRNFVQRIGDVALIGLDTGEDKPDSYPGFAGIFQMDRYRDLQTEWLAQAVESPAVKTARFKVAVCHIPLYHPNWRDPELPGGDGPKKKGCAAMTRPCALRWRPYLDNVGVNLVVSGHTHSYRHYAPSADCPWTQIVGGGCPPGPHESGYATVVEGFVDNGNLRIRVHDVSNGVLKLDEKIA